MSWEKRQLHQIQNIEICYWDVDILPLVLSLLPIIPLEWKSVLFSFSTTGTRPA